MDLADVSLCIKHTSAYPSRRRKLSVLLKSLHEYYGAVMRVLVASEPGHTQQMRKTFRSYPGHVEHVMLPENAGLSSGRNALVRAVQTTYAVVVDDDLEFRDGSSLRHMLTQLRSDDGVAIVGGCYQNPKAGEERDCFNLQFLPSADGSIVHADRVHLDAAASTVCSPVHLTHNFFMARTAILRRFGWDERQRVMEHETFFYQLFLNQQRVLVCPTATVLHNRTLWRSGDKYETRSLRASRATTGGGDGGVPYLQYLCKNFPEVRRFITPYVWWYCDQRVYCSPNYGAQFAFDGRFCQPIPWDEAEDDSHVRRPLVPPYLPSWLFPPSPPLTLRAHVAASDSPRVRYGPANRHVPLLVLVFTTQNNVARRVALRRSWLAFGWHRGFTDERLVPWRYLFVRARQQGHVGGVHSEEDEVIGDTVTLSRAEESYHGLVFKTIEALRWALASVSFDVVLKTDDDSVVHIGRVWHWLNLTKPNEPSHAAALRQRLYAGRLVTGTQVVRPSFRRSDLWEPAWYPANFLAWAVPASVYAEDTYPPYCSGGGYLLGADAALRLLAASDARDSEHVIPVEDAFLGVLARELGVSPVSMPGVLDLLLDENHTQQWDERTGSQYFIDRFLVHRVRQPPRALRWLMRSVGSAAPWSRRAAFANWNCPNCEDVLFADD